MAEKRLRKVLGRFRKSDLQRVLRRLGVDGENTNKRQLIATAVTKLLRTNVTQRDITGIELQYILSHQNSVSWTSYKLHPIRDLNPADTENHTFLKKFQLYLGDVCRYDLADTIHSSHHWMCLHFEDSGKVPYSCFLVRTPPTPFILLSGIRKKHLTCVMEALAMSLECRAWSEMQLSAHHMSSLLDLLVYQHSQGPYAAYRFNQVDPNPLLSIVKRRRHWEESPDCNDTDTEKRAKLAEKAFGSDPPVLEQFTFELKGSDSDIPLCKVKLAGTSVLEGVKQCISQDYLTLPLPECVANMHSFASNSLVVEETSLCISTNTADNSSTLVVY